MSTILLVVEDNDLDAERIDRILRRVEMSCPVVRARNGREALDVLREELRGKIGDVLVLVDLNMPIMNGFELLGALRGDPLLAAIDVAVLSTSNRPADIAAVRAHDVVDYIVKPISGEQLVAAIETHETAAGRGGRPG